MAKHIVKCLHCGMSFDTNTVPFVKIKNRYAHQNCPKEGDDGYYELSQDDVEKQERKELFDYIKLLLGNKANWALIGTQINDFRENQNYSYSGMLKCLQYTVNVKHFDWSQSSGVAAISRWYDYAKDYYYRLWKASADNAEKNIQDFIPKQKWVKIISPERKIKKDRFLFFQEDVE